MEKKRNMGVCQLTFTYAFHYLLSHCSLNLKQLCCSNFGGYCYCHDLKIEVGPVVPPPLGTHKNTKCHDTYQPLWSNARLKWSESNARLKSKSLIFTRLFKLTCTVKLLPFIPDLYNNMDSSHPFGLIPWNFTVGILWRQSGRFWRINVMRDKKCYVFGCIWSRD